MGKDGWHVIPKNSTEKEFLQHIDEVISDALLQKKRRELIEIIEAVQHVIKLRAMSLD